MPGVIHYDFSGSVVVVTGGARGQGLSHSIAFAEAGAKVVVLDLKEPEMKGVPYSLSDEATLENAKSKLPGDSQVLAVDITDEKAVLEAFSQVQREYQRLDVLVNNAGVNTLGDIESTNHDQWQSVIGVNLWGSYLCSKCALPLLKKSGGGRIINIASLVALRGTLNQVPYAASKAGVIGLTYSLAHEAGPYRITVNAICPSLVVSPQTIGLNKARQNAAKTSPAGSSSMPYVLAGMNALEPKDVTAAVLWLASEAARFVTGIALVIDGGRSIK